MSFPTLDPTPTTSTQLLMDSIHKPNKSANHVSLQNGPLARHHGPVSRGNSHSLGNDIRLILSTVKLHIPIYKRSLREPRKVSFIRPSTLFVGLMTQAGKRLTSGWLVQAHVDKKNNFHMFLGLQSMARMRLPFSVYKQFRSMVGSRGITARWKLCPEIFIASNLQCCDLGGTIRATRGYHLFPAGSMRVEAK